MRGVTLDPELLAAAILGRVGPRRLLGLLAYGRWAQYVELLGPAELALIADERNAGARVGGISVEELVAQAEDRRALLTDRLPYGAPDDLVLVSSVRIIDAAVERVEEARRNDPVARAQTDLAERARHIIDFVSVGLSEDVLGDASLTESMRDHLVHVAAIAPAALVSDDEEIAPEGETMWRHVDPLGGAPAFAVTSSTFIEAQVNAAPFSIDSAPRDLLDLAVTPPA